MHNDKFFHHVYTKFERAIILALAIAIMIAIAYATIVFLLILIKTVVNIEPLWTAIAADDGMKSVSEPISRLQSGLYHVFGGFLLILLGIELINTVRSYSTSNHIKMESIISIAIIATARHLITLDYHHTQPLMVFAVGFVVLALVVGYFLLKLQARHKPDQAE